MVALDLTLRYLYGSNPETRTVAVLGSAKNWKLTVRWDNGAGLYTVDLRLNRLRRSERGSVLLWECVDLDRAKKIWHDLTFPVQATVAGISGVIKAAEGRSTSLARFCDCVRDYCDLCKASRKAI